MPEPQLDPILQEPIRLRVCGLLRRADEVEFWALLDTLNVPAGPLLAAVKALIDASYVGSSGAALDQVSDRRKAVWLSLTPTGRSGFDRQVEALRRTARSAF